MPFYPPGSIKEEEDRREPRKKRGWEYWARHQEENLRQALGSELFDAISEMVKSRERSK